MTVARQLSVTAGFGPPPTRNIPLFSSSGRNRNSGALILNADDWGRDPETTDRTLDCVRCGTISSVSAMMFMEDSERAAEISRYHGIDAGLHLNFTSVFSAKGTSPQLIEHQMRLSGFLKRSRFSQVLFHPGLTRSFEYVVRAQRDEFTRRYGKDPERIDGHHHMHLSANVLFGRLLPRGTIVRRNFSFQPGEKGLANRGYRQTSDWILSQRHRVADFFFSIQPLEPEGRLQEIFNLSKQYVVEVETHPKDLAEYTLLTGKRMAKLIGDCTLASRYEFKSNKRRKR